MSSTRYEYAFVQIELRSGWWSSQPAEDYHGVIEERAEQGWRLVQIFAPPIVAYGTTNAFELIFERPAEDHAEGDA